MTKPVRGMIAVDKIGCKILFLNPQTYETETALEGFQRTVHELLVMPEAGFANADTTIWFAVFMPSKTPRAVVDKFHAAGMKVLATPAMKAKLKQLAVDPMPMTPTEIDALVVKELSSNEKLIKAAGIKQ